MMICAYNATTLH